MAWRALCSGCLTCTSHVVGRLNASAITAKSALSSWRLDARLHELSRNDRGLRVLDARNSRAGYCNPGQLSIPLSAADVLAK
jgi:hypothetical protein